MTGYKRELEIAQALALEAGALLLSHRAAGLKVEHKTGADDPVTAADRGASALIMQGLYRAFPADGLLSEEEPDNPERLECQRVWIIDPVDGTQEYTTGSPDFCVSIGLTLGGEAVLGVVYAPATDELFCGAVSEGVSKNGEAAGLSRRPEFVVSVSDTEFRRELGRYALPGMQPSGSIALKLARLAAGESDVTFTISPRNEWDIAAGDALLRAGGGFLQRRDGQAITYNNAAPQITQGIMGGRPEAVAWLGAQLLHLGIPTTHLNVMDTDQAWGALGETDQVLLCGRSGINIRYTGDKLLALLVVDAGTHTVERAEGDAFHLERLTRDVVRAAGPFKTAPLKTAPRNAAPPKDA